MTTIEELQQLVIKFRDERNWQVLHNPKDCALAMIIEAAELGEHFRWRDAKEAHQHALKHKEKIGDELADVLYHLLVMAHDLEIDLGQAFKTKLKKDAHKYPPDKAWGNPAKYNEL